MNTYSFRPPSAQPPRYPQPLYVKIAETEFHETTADALADRLADLLDAQAAPAIDLFMAAQHRASTTSIGYQAFMSAVQARRLFG